ALGVRTAPAGFTYLDPASGANVLKLTSEKVPAGNRFAYHDYSEGGPLLSAEWGDGMHTVLIRVQQGRDTLSTWLVDYQRGPAAVKTSNWRKFPPRLTDLTLSFSNRPGFEQILYYLSGNRLYRFNTATMKREGEGSIPNRGFKIEGRFSRLQWLQVSRNDEWFVFQSSAEDRVFAFNRLSGDLRTRQFPGLDEPALDRGGSYVLIRDGGGGSADCPLETYTFENVWHLWKLADDTVTCRGGPVDGYIYAAHTGWGRGLFPSVNSAYTHAPNFYFDPARSGPPVETADYADANHFSANHHALQWIQDADDATQWYYGSNFDQGRVSATAWSLHADQVYRTGIDWQAQYQKPEIGVRSVYQTDPANPALLRHTLRPAASVRELREGSYFYDAVESQLYVWMHGGGSPDERTVLAAAGPIHDGIGARRMDGSDVRLVAHHYSWPGGESAYRQSPFATTSPDGKLIMFTSNMGLRDLMQVGRVDVFLVEIPVSGSEAEQQGRHDP
ncbi:MAG: hypothetical protein WD396_10570, partial [Pseudohongiellaceae bacterium]